MKFKKQQHKNPKKHSQEHSVNLVSQTEEENNFRTQHLFMDTLIFITAYFLPDLFFSKGGYYSQLENWQKLGIFNVAIVAITYYLGYLYFRYKIYYKSGVMKIFQWVFILIGIMVIVYLIRLMVLLGDAAFNLSTVLGFMWVFTPFNIVITPFFAWTGYMVAEDEAKEISEGGNGSSLTKLGYLFIPLILLLLTAFIVYIAGLTDGEWWTGIVVIFGAPVGVMIVLLLLFGIFKVLVIFKIAKLSLSAINYSIPIIITGALIFWFGVATNFMISDYKNNSGSIHLHSILFLSIFSGLVPYRIIMMFYPPYKIINIITGVISIGFLIGNIFWLVR